MLQGEKGNHLVSLLGDARGCLLGRGRGSERSMFHGFCRTLSEDWHDALQQKSVRKVHQCMSTERCLQLCTFNIHKRCFLVGPQFWQPFFVESSCHFVQHDTDGPRFLQAIGVHRPWHCLGQALCDLKLSRRPQICDINIIISQQRSKSLRYTSRGQTWITLSQILRSVSFDSARGDCRV